MTELLKQNLIILTDLDGTLLDHQTYRYDAALPALRLVTEQKIPLVFVTSKTRAEVEALDQRLAQDGIERNAPFVFENGSGIAIPAKAFDQGTVRKACQLPERQLSIKRSNHWWIVSFGKTSYQQLCQILDKKIAPLVNGQVVGFHQMTAGQLAEDAGLSVEEAKLAKEREFDEPFKIAPAQELPSDARRIIQKHRLSYTIGGRYQHLLSTADKGLATQVLTKLYQTRFGSIMTIGIGDSQNDLEFLTACDQAFLIANPDKKFSLAKLPQKIRPVPISGPRGWNEVVNSII